MSRTSVQPQWFARYVQERLGVKKGTTGLVKKISIQPESPNVLAIRSRTGLRLKWLVSRWLLVCLFPIGFLLTNSAYEDTPHYFGVTALATIACAVLLTRLKFSLEITFPVWIILAVFVVGYYLKFYWMTWVLESNTEWPFDSIFLAPASSPTLMFRVYTIMTLGFVTFCLLSWLLLGWRMSGVLRKNEIWGERAEIIRSRIVRSSISLLFILALAMAITGYVEYITGIAVAGAESVYLPFRLAGLIFYSRIVTMPALLILIIWLAEQWQLRKIHSVALALLILHGFIQMLLASSRGALLNMILPLVFLWLLSARFTAGLRNLLLALFFIVAWMHPVLSQYRQLRAAGDIYDIAYAFTESLRASGDIWTNLSRGISSIISRVTGTESLLFAAQMEDVSFTFESIRYYLFNPERSLARIYTQDVVGFGPSVMRHLSAPSLLGAFYLIGGDVGVIIGVAGWTLFWIWFWRVIRRVRWQSLPVAQSMILLLIFQLSSEGDIDALPLRELIYGASLLLCEFLARRLMLLRPGSSLVGNRP